VSFRWQRQRLYSRIDTNDAVMSRFEIADYSGDPEREIAVTSVPRSTQLAFGILGCI
jgi:hypothetical protein